MGFWPSQAKYCAANNISKEQIIDGLISLSTFVTTITTHVREDMDEVLERAGWHKLPFAVQQLLMSELGAVVLGAAFRGIREAHASSGIDPTENHKDLVEYATLMGDLFRMSPTRRFIRRYVVRIKEAFKVLFRKVEPTVTPPAQVQEIYEILLAPLRVAQAAPPATTPVPSNEVPT